MKEKKYDIILNYIETGSIYELLNDLYIFEEGLNERYYLFQGSKFLLTKYNIEPYEHEFFDTDEKFIYIHLLHGNKNKIANFYFNEETFKEMFNKYFKKIT